MLARSLKARHINMIALGGSIGTGIFLGSGYTIHIAGPGGALLAYTIISIMVYCLVTSLGEMATHSPTSGSFCDYSTRYIGPSFGMAISINYWLNWTITIAVEVVAACIIIQYWFPHASTVLLAACLFALIIGMNLLTVRIYGEAEYFLSLLKVAVIIVFIILSIALVLDRPELSLHNFTVDDAPFHQGWHGFLSIFLIASYSFQGAELIGITAGETHDPNRAIPQAVRAVFWRLFLFYFLTMLLISLLVPYNDPMLMAKGTIHTSPFTLVFKDYLGSQLAANFINLMILVALISAANASVYAASRTMWYMGSSGQLPRLFSRLSKKNVPSYAMLATALSSIVFFMLSLIAHDSIFKYLVEISSLCGLLVWFGIAWSHYQFRKKIIKGQEDTLIYKAPWFPLGPLLAMLIMAAIVIGQIATASSDLRWYDYVLQYGVLLIFLFTYLLNKTIMRHQP